MKQKITLRTFLLMLGVLLCVGMQAASKIGTTVIENLKYTLFDDNTAEVVANDLTLTGSVVIPEKVSFNEAEYNVTSLGENAFARCTKITSVTVPAGVTKINAAAFSKCTNLESITLSENGVTSIGAIAFADCAKLASITLPNTLTYIGTSAFAGAVKLTSITIPNSVVTIDENAFSECTNLASVTLGTGLKDLARYVFNNCTSLATINIPEGITIINDNTFSNCTSLASINLPSSIIEIEQEAFIRSGLTSIIIPEKVDTIRARAFYECSKLETVNISSGVKYFHEDTFKRCSNLAQFTVSEANTTYATINDVLFNKKGSMLLAYPPSLKTKDYVVPNTVDSIMNYAAYECLNLTSITLPASLTYIGNSAFDASTNLKKVTSLATTPPQCISRPFAVSDTLIIPIGTISTYMATLYWLEFGNVRERYDDGKLAYYIAAEVEGDGKILINDLEAEADTLKEGTKVTFKFVPAEGKKIDKITINEKDVTTELANSSYVIEKIAVDVKVKATFIDGGSSISELNNEAIKVYSSSNTVIVANANEGEIITISNLAGQTVYQGTEKVISLNSGAFIVKVGDTIQKVMVK